MAKLTVYFKDKVIHVHSVDNGVVHIGRDETNDIIIDTNDVAPIHAVIAIRDDDGNIKPANDKFPLIVNNKKVKSWRLLDGDVLTFGKHSILYNTKPWVSYTTHISNTEEEIITDTQTDTQKDNALTGQLQIMSGRNIGKIMPIKNIMNRLGTSGTGVMAIAKRKEGYFASVLESGDKLMVNNVPLGDKTVKLEPNDVLTINDVVLQFFIG